MDVEDLRAGQYRDILSSQVRDCSDFILVLTPGSLERCLQEGDWVAREVAEALKLKKNIVPVSFEHVNWPVDLPPEMAELRDFQVCKLSNEYFAPSVARLIEYLKTKPRSVAKPALAALSAIALLGMAVGLALWTRWPLRHPRGTRPPPPASLAVPFSQLFVLHGPKGTNDVVELADAELELQTSQGRNALPIGPGGRVNFEFARADVSNQPATLALKAKGWDLKWVREPLTLSGDRPLWLEVEHKRFALHGTVKDKDNNQPLPGLRVALEGLGTNTDSGGAFHLDVPGSMWRPTLELGMTNPGWIDQTFPVQDIEKPLPILCEHSPFTLVVHLRGPGGAKGISTLANQSLKLQAEGVVRSVAATIDTQGEARFGPLAAMLRGKPATFTLEAPGWRVKPGPSLALGEVTVPLDVERTGIVVSGRVLEAEHDSPLKGAWVSVAGLATNTDAGGAFAMLIPNARLGPEAQVTVSCADYQTVIQPLKPSAEALNLRLRKPESLTLVVSLSGPEGQGPVAALANAMLKLQAGPSASEAWTATVSEQGQARFQGLPRALLAQEAVLSLAAQCWQLKGGQARIRLLETPVTVEVERTGAVFTGLVKSEGDNAPLPEVQVIIGGVATNTDQHGSFALLLSKACLQAPILLKAGKAGWEDLSREVTLDAGPLVLPLKRRPATPPPAPSPEERNLQAEVDKAPQSFHAHYKYGKFLYDSGRLPQAEEQLTNAVALAREGQNAQPGELADSLNTLGLVYGQRNQPTPACQAFDGAIEQVPGTWRKGNRPRPSTARTWALS